MTSGNTKIDETSRVDDAAVPPRRRRLPRVELSATQVIATGFAGITATFLASYLGVSGTIIGAAVVSMATAIGNAVYGHSLRTTRDRVRDVVPFGRTDPASPTVVMPAAERDDPEPGDDDAKDHAPLLPAGRRDSEAMPARAWKRVAMVAVVMFAAVLAVVTSIELLAGRPVTDLVRGDSGSGTTLFGANTTKGDDTPVPTITRTVTPSVVITTPTVTQTAPPVTRTSTPTTTTTPSTNPTQSPSTGTTTGTPAPSQTEVP